MNSIGLIKRLTKNTNTPLSANAITNFCLPINQKPPISTEIRVAKIKQVPIKFMILLGESNPTVEIMGNFSIIRLYVSLGFARAPIKGINKPMLIASKIPAKNIIGIKQIN